MRLSTMKRHLRVSTLSILLALPLAAAGTTRVWVLNNNGEGKQIQIIDRPRTRSCEPLKVSDFPTA